MRRVTQTEEREIMMKLMCFINEVCEVNGIEYSLGGGTLLGAIRHKGFIPWDDDIDFMLIRDEYNKLIKVLRTRSLPNMRLIDQNDKGNPYVFAKLCDSRTLCKGPLSEIKGMGVYVDIFPIDFLPDEKEARWNFSSKIRKRQRNLNFFSLHTYNKATSYKKKIAKTFLYYPKYLQYKVMYSEKIEKHDIISDMSKFNNKTGIVGFTGSQYSPKKEFFPIEDFNQYVLVDFEGYKFHAIKGFENYLKQLYGDFMKLPPEDARVNHSYYKWFWKENRGS